MAVFLLRVELPDRPGALGAVASRIGSVRGDVVAVEIVERWPGSAVDEFVVELDDENALGLLLTEVTEVDGVSVEEVRPIAGGRGDARLDAYDTAVAILRERSPHAVLEALSSRVRAELDAAWAAVLDVQDRLIVAAAGRLPAAPWLATYVEAQRGGEAERGLYVDGRRTRRSPLGDVVWVDLGAWDLVLCAGRPGWRFAVREQARLAALARLADARWVDLAEREARMSHPSRAG